MADACSARLLLPSPALGSCVFAAALRDTRGLDLTDDARFNYYPSTPLPSLHWVFEGRLHLVLDGQAGQRPALGPALPRLLVSGPQRRPTVSWSAGPVHALSVSFFPEALERLLGVAATQLSERCCPLHEVAPADFVASCETLFEHLPTIEPFTAVEAALQPLWQGVRAARRLPLLTDWIVALGRRTAQSSAGRSARQLQRRLKTRTGLSLRELQLYTRVEAAMMNCLGPNGASNPRMADVAADSGYADQSHMNREIRRVTGLTAAALLHRIRSDEAFWLYRLIGEVVAADASTGLA